MGDKEWTVEVWPTDEFYDRNTNILPLLILLGGVMLGLVLALIIYYAHRTRIGALLIQEKEALLAMFVEHTPAAVAMFDKDLNYLAVSQRWYVDYGLEDKGNLVGKNHYEVFPEIKEEHPEWVVMHQRVLGGEVISSNEDEFLSSGNQKYWLKYELVPWYKASGVVGGLIMFTENITSRKKMEEELKEHRDHLQEMVDEQTKALTKAKNEAERLNKLKSEFLSNMSHELRTPMHAILNFTRMCEEAVDGGKKEEQREYLEYIEASAIRLSKLINNLLDLSKIEAGKMHYEMLEHTMLPIIDVVVKEISSVSEEKLQKIEVIADKEINFKTVLCDSEKMHQVFLNLLSNAIKFSPESSAIDVCVFEEDASLLIQVKDRGVGVPDDEKEAIFDKFIQSQRTATGAGGTGLGLAICKEIVLYHKGQIYVENREDGGAVFTVKLPLCTA